MALTVGVLLTLTSVTADAAPAKCDLKAKVVKCPKADLRKANFKGVNLRGANLRGVNLEGVKFYGTLKWGPVDLTGANLSKANLYKTGFNFRDGEDPERSAKVVGINFSDAIFLKATTRKNWKGETVTVYNGGTSFSYLDLTNSNFSNTILGGSRFYHANLTGVNFSGTALGTSFFRNANLTGVNFSGADLSGALFYPPYPDFTGVKCGPSVTGVGVSFPRSC